MAPEYWVSELEWLGLDYRDTKITDVAFSGNRYGVDPKKDFRYTDYTLSGTVPLWETR